MNSSEKTAYVMGNGCQQMCMFEETGDCIEEKSAAAAENDSKTTIAVAAHKRKPKRTLEELCDIPEEEQTIQYKPLCHE